jgi:tetratricopeptide (TPR) repeat protein
MRRALVASSFYLAILLVGCTPVASVRPLYTAEETKKPYRDQHLEGEWTMAVLNGAEEEAKPIPPCHVKIRPAVTGDVTYSAQFRCPVQEGEEETHVEVQLVPLGNNIFFDARPVYLSDKLKKVDLRDLSGIGVLPGHVLGQVWAQENFVRFAPLWSEWVERNWPADTLAANHITQVNTIDVLTDQTASLRDLLSKNANSRDAFPLNAYLCRAGTDCDARAYEDQLARLPDDPWTLEVSARFFARRGDINRATGLMKHKIELDSDKQESQYDVAKLLLLGRDFEGARRALAQAKEPILTPSIKTLAVLSHFLQGDYAGTIEATQSMKDSQHTKSADPSIDDYFARNWHFADPILLRYFALCRLGRTEEAESYLSRQAELFSGEPTEKVLLLEVLGRVTARVPSEDLNRSDYYAALNNLQKGDRPRGHDQLVDLTRRLPKDDVTRLAAQVELDRLSSPK